MRDLPTGTVTFLFTDIEGSTRLLEEAGPLAYDEALAEHRRVLREAFARQGGVEVDTQGDAFFYAFPTAAGAVRAAAEGQEALGSGPVRVRMGLHTGTPHVGLEGYVGMDVHRAARIAAAGHGGQILVSASTAAAVEDGLRDLGAHRFKDLAAAERVYQFGDLSFPPIKSIYRTNLPVPSTPFLGRARELDELVALLSSRDARLVSVLGPGGAGKTRLAVQAAAEVSELFPDGVFWAALAPLRDASVLEGVIAQALEVSEQPSVPPLETAVEAFAQRTALLLLDNCEHLIDPVAAAVQRLVEGCPRLLIVCSSRQRLGLRSERAFVVAPLSDTDAVSLFEARAQAVSPGFELDEHVPAICTALDGLPLAIELAAARVRALSTKAIRQRLTERLPLLSSRDRDVDERQRTLEATIAWSYNLLDPEEQHALRALSVFAAGCTLDAAETVAGADLDLLESLLDKSLIRHRLDEAGQDRYWLLETIREYAAARLAEAGDEDSVRQAHRDHYLRAAAELSGDGFIHNGSEVPYFQADRANYRLVLSEALAEKDPSTALGLVASLGHIWHRAGEVADGYALIQAALVLPGGPEAIRGRALHLAGDMAVDLGQLDAAQRLLDQAEATADELDDRWLRWRVEYTRSYLQATAGAFDEAAASSSLAIELAHELGSNSANEQSMHMHIQALRALATQADPPDRAMLEECATLAEEALGRATSALDEAFLHGELSMIHFALGDHGHALYHVTAELELRRETLGSRQAMFTVFFAGVVAGRLGDHQAAVELSSAALAAMDREGFTLDNEDRRLLTRLEVDAHAALGDSGYDQAVENGRALTIPAVAELVLRLAADSHTPTPSN